MARLSEKPGALPAIGDHMNDDVDSINWHLFTFEVVWMDFASMSVLSDVSASDVDVFLHMEYVGGQIICCDTPPMPLRTCIANLPRKAKLVGDRAPSSANAATSTSAIVRELPWADKLVKRLQRQRGAPELEPSDDESADWDDIDVDTLGGVVEGTWAELEEIRRKWATDPEQRCGDLCVSVGRRMDSEACRGVSRRDPRTCARPGGESMVLGEGRPHVGQVRDQGPHRVARRRIGPRLVLQNAALLHVVPHEAKRQCPYRRRQNVVGRAQ